MSFYGLNLISAVGFVQCHWAY